MDKIRGHMFGSVTAIVIIMIFRTYRIEMSLCSMDIQERINNFLSEKYSFACEN